MAPDGILLEGRQHSIRLSWIRVTLTPEIKRFDAKNNAKITLK
jgi:hypothetical protein